jgi:hypothetical protein
MARSVGLIIRCIISCFERHVKPHFKSRNVKLGNGISMRPDKLQANGSNFEPGFTLSSFRYLFIQTVNGGCMQPSITAAPPCGNSSRCGAIYVDLGKTISYLQQISYFRQCLYRFSLIDLVCAGHRADSCRSVI